jgi:hypothetical protein
MISPLAFLYGGLRVLIRSTPKPAVVITFVGHAVAVFAHGAVALTVACTTSPLRFA